MNVVEVPKHNWFWIPPDVPHAYIKGELCECMINSDNVVRGGLTPKLKDIKTLLEILPFDQCSEQGSHKPEELNGGQLAEYKWKDYPELRVFKLSLKAGEVSTLPKMIYCAVMLVLDGSIKANGKELAQHSTWFVLPGS